MITTRHWDDASLHYQGHIPDAPDILHLVNTPMYEQYLTRVGDRILVIAFLQGEIWEHFSYASTSGTRPLSQEEIDLYFGEVLMEALL